MTLSSRVARIEANYGLAARTDLEPFRWDYSMSVANNEHMKSLHQFFGGLGPPGLDKLLADISQHGRSLVSDRARAA